METIGISTWSVRHLLGPVYPGLDPAATPRRADANFGPGELDLLDLPTAMRARGYDTLDLCHFHLPRTDDVYLALLRQRLDAAGIVLLTFLVDEGDLSAADPAQRARDVALTEAWLPIAARLGARYVRVAAGLTEAAPTDPAIGWSAASLLTLAEAARARGTTLLTETWRPLAMPPGECARPGARRPAARSGSAPISTTISPSARRSTMPYASCCRGRSPSTPGRSSTSPDS